MIGKAVRNGALLALAAVAVVRILTRQNRGEPQLYTPEPESDSGLEEDRAPDELDQTP